jgi:hypothetical protein
VCVNISLSLGIQQQNEFIPSIPGAYKQMYKASEEAGNF